MKHVNQYGRRRTSSQLGKRATSLQLLQASVKQLTRLIVLGVIGASLLLFSMLVLAVLAEGFASCTSPLLCWTRLASVALWISLIQYVTWQGRFKAAKQEVNLLGSAPRRSEAPETAALQAELSKKANLLEKAKGLLDKVEGQLVKKTKEVTNLRAEVAELQKKVDLPGSPSARSLPKMKTPPRLQVVLEN